MIRQGRDTGVAVLNKSEYYIMEFGEGKEIGWTGEGGCGGVINLKHKKSIYK